MTKKQLGSGRTIFIPKTSPINQVPPASPNGAITNPLSEPCNGPWCSIPVTPTALHYLNNLESSNPPPDATSQYIGTLRVGNNFVNMPNVQPYIGAPTNSGPFNINCLQCGKRVPITKSVVSDNTPERSVNSKQKGSYLKIVEVFALVVALVLALLVITYLTNN